jgi:hypothetical protein
MARAVLRRLPGVRFEVQAPPLPETLPRMDVAAFVGFAASGPLHVPVAVEDAAHFSAIFGDDAVVAWDGALGEPVRAYLGPAVRAFFRNGGRRAWVVRVAGEGAASNDFPLPGVLALEEGALAPAYARARSEGSWSDGVTTAAALLSRSLSARALGANFPDDLSVDLVLASLTDLAPGDLVRLAFRLPRAGLDPLLYVLLMVVGAVDPVPLAAGAPFTEEAARSVRVSGSAGVWLCSEPPGGSLAGTAGAAIVFGPGGVERSIPVTLISAGAPGDSDPIEPAMVIEPFAGEPDDRAYLPGTTLRVDLGASSLFFAVDEARFVEVGPVPGEVVRVSGRGLFHLPGGPPAADRAALTAALPVAERLGFELWIRQGEEGLLRSGELGFTAQSPLFWAALPTDAELYRGAEFRAVGGRPPTGRDALIDTDDDTFAALRARAADPRFPLAGRGAGDVVYVPLGAPILPEHYLGAAPRTDTAADRDGLAQFDAAAFLDADLSATSGGALLPEADFLRYQSPDPRPLRGLHALFSLDEVTLAAVPDAVHRGWALGEDAPAPIDPAPPAVPSIGGSPGTFRPCSLRVLDAPVLLLVEGPSAVGTFALEWSQGPDAGAAYTVEESLFFDYREVTEVYSGPGTRLELFGRPPGDYYYRVRVAAGGNESGFSAGVVVRVAAARRGTYLDPEHYAPAGLLAVQRALLRVCAARGDLFAVLALPEHYREASAVAHAAALRSAAPSLTAIVPPLGLGEALALSYGAIHHPWLIGREEGISIDLRRTPPDGAATGLLARRAIERGAWIAPANEELRGAVALTPPLAADRLPGLKDAAVNIIRQDPRGFLVLGADTLSDDPDLVPIGVRRLLILLRRAALRLGSVYVFEPNDPAFRRAVERGFEAMLGQMYLRGAFAGQKPEDAFQVVTDATLNTPAGVDAGRFVVELKVAPSLPLTFLTVRLVQNGDRSLVTEVR